jgi:hypothetical protein
MKKTIVNSLKCAAIALPLAFLAGCTGSTDADDAAPDAQEGNPLYLRGEMNDYGVNGNFKLKKSDDGLCTEAALRAEWAPYKFKFADEYWSKGANYGYMEGPGELSDGSAPVKLNPESKFEDLKLNITKDGIYRFCLVKKDDGAYATVKFVREGDEKSLSETK